MSALFGNIFRRKFLTFSIRQCHQCPRRSLTPPSKRHEGGYKLYKALGLYAGIPILLALTVVIYLKKKACPEEREPFAKYPYLRLRSKRFPWGDGTRSFFHNRKLNPLPDGYEDDEEQCEESE